MSPKRHGTENLCNHSICPAACPAAHVKQQHKHNRSTRHHADVNPRLLKLLVEVVVQRLLLLLPPPPPLLLLLLVHLRTHDC